MEEGWGEEEEGLGMIGGQGRVGKGGEEVRGANRKFFFAFFKSHFTGYGVFIS